MATQVELVEPPAGARPGDRVGPTGLQPEPVTVLKKDAFDLLAASLATDASCVACYKGAPLETSSGACTVQSIANGPIK